MKNHEVFQDYFCINHGNLLIQITDCSWKANYMWMSSAE